MVCFVHDRQFLSKFHGAVNQLRRTNEFSITTLQQLPKRCCSCPGKTMNTNSTMIEPVLISTHIDALRVICLWLELNRCVANHVCLLPPQTLGYTILPFPTSLEPQEQAIKSEQFITQQDVQLRLLEQIHHARLQFVTSTSPEELQKRVLQLKCDLIAKCSNYLEASEVINGLCIIISMEDESRADIVKHALRQQWKRFFLNIPTHDAHVVYNWQQNLPLKAPHDKCSRLHRSFVRYQMRLKKQEEKRQARQKPLQKRTQFIQAVSEEAEDEREEYSQFLVETMLYMPHPGLWFLSNKYQDSSKSKSSRSHRRQQILAFAMLD